MRILKIYFFIVAAALLLIVGIESWPEKSLISFATELATKIGDPQKIAYAGDLRLTREFTYCFYRLKGFLPLLGFALIAWGGLWYGVQRRPAQEKPRGNKTPDPLLSYPLLFLLMAVALCLRLFQFNMSFFFDELTTITRYIRCDNFFKGITSAMYINNHILFSGVSHILYLIFGDKSWIYRGPALLFGVLGVGALGSLSGLLKDKGIVMASLLLLAFSPLHVELSQLARGYTMLVFFTILSLYFFMRGCQENSPGVWRGFGIATVLGLYTHLYMVMVFLSEVIVVALGVFVLKDKRQSRLSLIDGAAGRNFFLTSTLALGFVFLLYLPSLPALAFEYFRDYPRYAVDFSFFASLLKAMGPGETGFDPGLISFLLALAGVFYAGRRNRLFALLGVVLCIFPLVLVQWARPIYLCARFFVFMMPVYLIFMAAGISALVHKIRPQKPRFLTALLLILIIFLNGSSLYLDVRQEKQPYRQAAAFIDRAYPKEVAVIAPGFAGSLISYYGKSRPVIEVLTLEKTQEALRLYPEAVFFVTYQPLIDKDILSFMDAHYRQEFFARGLISSTRVYAKKSG